MDKVERVARAMQIVGAKMYEAEFGPATETASWENSDQEVRDFLMSCARATIEELDGPDSTATLMAMTAQEAIERANRVIARANNAIDATLARYGSNCPRDFAAQNTFVYWDNPSPVIPWGAIKGASKDA